MLSCFFFWQVSIKVCSWSSELLSLVPIVVLCFSKYVANVHSDGYIDIILNLSAEIHGRFFLPRYVLSREVKFRIA